MEITIYLGAPGTDADLLFAALRKNEERLWQHGVSVPPPERYAHSLRKVIDTLGDLEEIPEEILEALLEVIHGYGRCKRLVLMDTDFLSPSGSVVDGYSIWPHAATDIRKLARLFRDCTVSVFIAMRNPILFLPSIFVQNEGGLESFEPDAISWSEFHTRVTTECPSCAVTTWCAEDTLVLWDELMQSLAGVGPETLLYGRLDLLRKLTTPDGFRMLETYFDENPSLSSRTRQEVIADYLEKHGLDEEMEIKIYLPSADGKLLDSITEAYKQDMHRLRGITGVKTLEP